MPNSYQKPDGSTVSEASVISAYFKRENQSAMDIMKEIRELSPESKTELADGAAKELGFPVIS